MKKYLVLFFIVLFIAMIESVNGTEPKGEGQFLDPFTLTMRPRALVLKQNYRNSTPIILRSRGINPRLFIRKNRMVKDVYVPQRPVSRSAYRPCSYR